MKRVGIVYLITESPEAAGVLDERTETRRKTYCEEISLSMSEVYQARASGFSPIFRLRLPQDFEYRKETLCEYKKERYSIIRDYRDEKTGNATELTLERVRGNAAAPAEEPEPEPDPNKGDPSPSAQDDTQGTNGNATEAESAEGEGDPSTPPDGSAQDDTAGTGGSEQNGNQETAQGQPAETGETTESESAPGGTGEVTEP